jgi:predicted enzyme related to lactoylglutathione lyase
MRGAEHDRRVDCVEFPATDMEKTKRFYSTIFGWEFVDYGPDYMSFADGRLDGGRITQEIFEFPGGRRFHVTDPNGNELAVWSDR